MSKIKDVFTPNTTAPSSVTQPSTTVVAKVIYGSMINGIPNLQSEPFSSFDDALAFASTILDTNEVLFIEYSGLRLGVNA